MNIEKFTINASKRIQEAQDLANKNRNPQIMPIHLLVAILQAPDSLAREILTDMEVDIQQMLAQSLKELQALPQMEGYSQLTLSQELNGTLLQSEEISEKYGDQYITEEHLLLSLIDFGGPQVQMILQSADVTTAKVHEVMEEMR